MLGLTFLCMVLLGVGFFTLSYRYQLQEIQTTLDRNAGFISSYADAALTKGGSLTDESFVNYIHSVVLLTDTTVLVCDTDGQVLCAAGTPACPPRTAGTQAKGCAGGSIYSRTPRKRR